MTKVKIFNVTIGTGGWHDLQQDINNFLKKNILEKVTQSGGNEFVCITLFYREKSDDDTRPY